jgi:energy-coupling factor transport system ATP-binding protein
LETAKEGSELRINPIECRKLWHSYPGGFNALKDTDLNVSTGEIVGIVGQNGSGKTTLVKHFNGLLKPSSGTVTINGIDTAEESVFNLSRQTGYVFQNPNHQLFATSVMFELQFGPNNLGLSEDEVLARVEETAELFQLQDIINEHPLRLSFPLRKIVAMASIYAMQPSIFILDEPTTGQDHKGAAMVRKLIQQLHSEGKTVILVSHDMALIAEVADRVVAMWAAEVIDSGTPREIFSNSTTLKKTMLQPPQATQLSQRLHGRVLPRLTLTVDETIDALAQVADT